jgi:predicted DNA-binding transcriptional regulator YafY
LGKASRLNELATMVAAHRMGVRLDHVVERFGVSRRTAQRMMRILEDGFPGTQTGIDHEGRKVWRISGAAVRSVLNVSPDELACESFAGAGHTKEAARLRALTEKVLALVPDKHSARLEPDRDALLEAQGMLARPGPRPKIDSAAIDTIAEAIKSCRVLVVEYKPAGREMRRHRVAPLGILLGLRRYLIAWKKGKPDGWTSIMRVDNIRGVRLDDESFERPEWFDLRAYAKRSFGAFQNDREFADVVWRFAPSAADHADCFEFHPDQHMQREPDGSLTVRFRAAGHLEMCWFLYAWGDKVEVLSPPELRGLVARHRRGDFPALP